MNNTYIWKIESISDRGDAMIVSYTQGDTINKLNIPTPGSDQDMDEWIDRYAPRNSWISVDISHIVVGSEGTGDFTSHVSSVDSTTSGNINIDSAYVNTADAHIAAIVQQVLTNMAENTI